MLQVSQHIREVGSLLRKSVTRRYLRHRRHIWGQWRASYTSCTTYLVTRKGTSKSDISWKMGDIIIVIVMMISNISWLDLLLIHWNIYCSSFFWFRDRTMTWLVMLFWAGGGSPLCSVALRVLCCFQFIYH